LRSAVVSYAALIDSSPAHVALDLAAIRSVLDLMVPIQAKISRKRWANLRSDLSAAIAASGLLQMLKTSTVELSESWVSLLLCAHYCVFIELISLLSVRKSPTAKIGIKLCLLRMTGGRIGAVPRSAFGGKADIAIRRLDVR
jgi:hypothetical protein